MPKNEQNLKVSIGLSGPVLNMSWPLNLMRAHGSTSLGIAISFNKALWKHVLGVEVFEQLE